MQEKRRRWWPVVKWAIILAILTAIGWRFVIDLSRPELYQQPLFGPRLLWLAPAALLYLAGMSLSGLYWWRLLVHLGAPAPAKAALRAYWLSQLGKYVPGKAWAVVMRVGLVRTTGTSAALASLTTFYEVLTTMASGALVATLLFLAMTPAWDVSGTWGTLRAFASLRWPDESALDALALATVSLGLVGVTLGPVLPAFFNRVVDRLSIPFRSGPAPVIRGRWLVEGLLITAPTWLLFGAALGCALQAIPGAELPFSPHVLAQLTAVMALAYVAGFVLLFPAGFGVREVLLTVVLAPELASQHAADPATARGIVVLAVLVLRLVWTAAELLIAGAIYWAPAGEPS
jgi:hypothetical protein